MQGSLDRKSLLFAAIAAFSVEVIGLASFLTSIHGAHSGIYVAALSFPFLAALDHYGLLTSGSPLLFYAAILAGFAVWVTISYVSIAAWRTRDAL